MDVGGIGPSVSTTSAATRSQSAQPTEKERTDELRAENSAEQQQAEDNVQERAVLNSPKSRGGNIDTYA